MILLTSTSDAISVVTSSAANTDVHASWMDNLSGVVTPGRTNTASIASATTTTIVPSPAASTQRNVKTVTIRNRHASTSQDVIVKHTDGVNNLEMFKCSLSAGEELIYTDADGWTHFLPGGEEASGFNQNAVAITGGTISGVTEVLAAGTASVAPLQFTSGTNLTAAAAGAIEYDGLIHYTSHLANARGANVSEQFIITPAANYTLTSQTAAQKMFSTPTNGALTVNAATTYQFESVFDLTTMSASSGTFGWALGGTATFTTIKWWSTANKAALSTFLAWQNTFNATAANTALATSTTATVGAAFINGIIRVNAGGTIIPSVSLSVAAAAVVQAGSYFRCWPIGTNTVASVGNWS